VTNIKLGVLMKNMLVVIPARGGSKGIPRKNIRLLNGKPLISYGIRNVLNSKHSLDVVVTTDDDEKEAKRIINEINFIDEIRRSGEIKFLESEKISRLNARRSLVTIRDVKKGETITREMLTFKRPGTGISPSEIENILGKEILIDIPEDTVLKTKMIMGAI
jgi:hypothetical protein